MLSNRSNPAPRHTKKSTILWHWLNLRGVVGRVATGHRRRQAVPSWNRNTMKHVAIRIVYLRRDTARSCATPDHLEAPPELCDVLHDPAHDCLPLALTTSAYAILCRKAQSENKKIKIKFGTHLPYDLLYYLYITHYLVLTMIWSNPESPIFSKDNLENFKKCLTDEQELFPFSSQKIMIANNESDNIDNDKDNDDELQN